MTWRRHPDSDRVLVHESGKHQIVRYDDGAQCKYELQERLWPRDGSLWWYAYAVEPAVIADAKGRALAVARLQGRVKK